MQTGGKALEDYAFRRASSSLDELMARSPRIAYRKMRELNKNNNTNGDRNCIGDQGLEEIKVTDIRIGDLLVVRPAILFLPMER